MSLSRIIGFQVINLESLGGGLCSDGASRDLSQLFFEKRGICLSVEL
jgi:hypothetical protein